MNFFNLPYSLFETEYFPIMLLILTATLLSVVFFSCSFIFSIQKPEPEKLSTYECGFEPYNDSRNKFNVKFYLIAIVFIVFDIETVFLLPWGTTFSKINVLGFWSMLDFIFELNFVYLYIWAVGGIDWD